MGSTLGVKYNLILALRSQTFEKLHETFDTSGTLNYASAGPV